jgi:hypothetical protein
MVDGSQWTALWYRSQELVYYESEPWDGGSGGSGYTDWDPEDWEWIPGVYEVRIFVGLQWKITGAFTVEGEAPPAPPSPTATRTPTPTPTFTPAGTPTPGSSTTLSPSSTSGPSTPSLTPSPTKTRWPTATAITPSPTITRWPSPTPTP